MAYKSKSYRKFLATGTTAALVASAIAPAASAADHPFTDVNTNYDEAVSYLYSNNITEGYTETTFGTYMSLTRGNAAVIIANALNLDTTSAADAGFEDVNSRVAGSVNALVEAGIMDGFSDTEFRPDVELSRGAMAKILVNAYDLQGQAMDTPFTDLTSTFGTYIEALYGAGITTGKTETTFGTNQEILRGEFAMLLYKSINFVPTPEVSSVMSSSSTEFTVNFEEAVEEGIEVEDLMLDVTVVLDNGTEVTPEVTGAKLSADRKSVTIMHKNNDLDGLKGMIMVNGVDGAFDYSEAKVSSVSAINATQAEIHFNQAVDAKSIFADGKSGAFASGVLSFRTIDGVTDGTLSGELSADGKVLTITSTQLLEKRYDVVVDKVKNTDGEAVEKFSEIIKIEKDTTAPTLLGAERVTANQVKIKFSEPMASAGSVTFKLADGTYVTTITGQGTLVEGGKAVVLDLSNASVPVNKDITATFVGAADKAGNLVAPNPAMVTFQKGDKDGVAPTVSSISQSGASTFEIKFSEVLVGKPTVAIDNVNVNPANVTISSTDATVVKVTAPSVLDGSKIVTVSNAVDGSGEVSKTTNSVVKFVKDTNAPTLVSSAVVADSTDKAEYLEFTFDKNVDLAAATVDVTSGSYVKDYVTTTLTDAEITPQSIAYKSADNHKVVRVKLATLLGDDSVTGAKYSVNLAFTNVASESSVPFTTGTATFTRGTDGTLQNTDVVAVSTIAQGSDNDKVVVTFDKNVDASTATTASNYIVGGAVVESATLNSTNLKQVTLKLKANSNTFSGDRNVTVQNVKAAGSTVAMTTTTKVVDLNENVVPTVSAKLQSDLKTIKLTFSEKVYQVANTTDDFAVLVGTEAYKYDHDANPMTADIAYKVDTNLGTTTATAASTIDLVLPSTVTADQLTKGLALKALNTIDIMDVEGNKLSVPANVTVSSN